MSINNFAGLGLDPRLGEILVKQGIIKPFPIQAETLPLALNGRDILAQARTGSGKTLAFALPALNYLLNHPFPGVADEKDPEILVLAPTRELCQQVESVFQELGGQLGIKTMAVYGGTGYDSQIASITRGIDVIVATPGRLIDLMQRGELSLAQVKIMVLDEADEMLDLGFADAVEKILAATNTDRQTLLFSATFSANIVGISRKYMKNPTRVTVEAELTEGSGTAKITQIIWRAHQMDKIEILKMLFSSDLGDRAIVFTNTKRNAQRVSDDLVAIGINSVTIHGDMQQQARERSFARFSEGKAQVLVATDVAARGLDVDDVTLVVNLECPDDERSYTHRIGRTGRAGKVGTALTLIDWKDLLKWKNISDTLGGDLPKDPPEIYSTSAVVIEMFPKVRELAPLKIEVKPKEKPVSKSNSKSSSKPVVRKKVLREKALIQEEGATSRKRVRTRNGEIKSH
jgi:superfamily II DNA/RNA helicase